MPETGAVIGTPASIRASVEPQTEPIDEEPFDSSVSETIRIVYGKSSADGLTASRARRARAAPPRRRERRMAVGGQPPADWSPASRARFASAPWPMSRRFGPRMKPVSPTEYGGEVEGGREGRGGGGGGGVRGAA